MTQWKATERAEYGSSEEYLRIIRQTLLKRWWLIALLALAASIAAFAGSFLVDPVYRAAVTIRIRRNVLGTVNQRGNSLGPTGLLDTEAEWIKNRLLLEDVLDKTGIAAMARSQEERVVLIEKLRDRISVATFSDSLQVTVDWNEPKITASLANALADTFVERYGALNREEAREIRALLEEQARLVRLKLDEAQRTFIEFRKKHGDIGNTVSDRGSASSERIAELRTQIAQDDIALAEESKKLEFVTKRMGADSQTLLKLDLRAVAEQVAANRSIQALRDQVSQLEERVRSLSSLFTDEWPELRKARQQLAEARQALATALAEIIPDSTISFEDPGKVDLLMDYVRIWSEVEKLKTRQTELTALASGLEEEVSGLPDAEAQYFTLLRNRTINEDLYNTLLTRLTEASIAEQTDTWDVRIIERAYPPHSRLRPKPAKNAVLGGIIGVLLGLGVCMLLEYLDDSFKTAEEVEGYLQLPVLAVLPRFDRLPELQYGSRKQG